MEDSTNEKLVKRILWRISKHKGLLENILKTCVIQSYSTKKYSKPHIFKNKQEKESYVYDGQNITELGIERPHFRQAIFHAGTKSEFFEFTKELKEIISDNDYNKVLKTFYYMFFEMKKGIFVYIQNNRIKIFLPFSNNNYKNNWYSLLRAPPSPEYIEGSILRSKLAGETGKKLNEKEWNPKIKKYFTEIEEIKEQASKDKSLSYLRLISFSRENQYEKLMRNNLDINYNMDKWYANNCLFRNEVHTGRSKELYGKPDEGDKSVANILELLTEMLYSVEVPDTYFFVNPRDFPILKKNGEHPYDAIFLPKYKIPNIIKDPKNLCKIFSFSNTEEYLDSLIPTDDDIVNVFKIYTASSIDPVAEQKIERDYLSKKSVAFFRGSATGCGLTEYTNKRIQLAYLSYVLKKAGPVTLDFRLTSLDKRLKKDPISEYCNYINENRSIEDVFEKFKHYEPDIRIKDLVTKDFVPDNISSGYKYIIDVDGHVSAFRLGRMFGFNSLIIKIDTPWKLWFSDKIKGIYYEDIRTVEDITDVHYLKVRVISGEMNGKHTSVIDQKHLVNTLRWVSLSEKNDNFGRIIAENGFSFYKEWICKEGLINYMREAISL